MCCQFTYIKGEESQSPSSTCCIASSLFISVRPQRPSFQRSEASAGEKGNPRKGKQLEDLNLVYCTAAFNLLKCTGQLKTLLSSWHLKNSQSIKDVDFDMIVQILPCIKTAFMSVKSLT